MTSMESTGRAVAALLSGALFALGLALGGMLDPNIVLGFLNVMGDWNPSLAFVMAGALAVYATGYRLVTRRPRPWLDDAWHHLPATGWDLSPSARVGAVTFGAGWGLSGFCPGPALVSVASLRPEAVTFTIAMIAGFAIHHVGARWAHRRATRHAQAAA